MYRQCTYTVGYASVCNYNEVDLWAGYTWSRETQETGGLRRAVVEDCTHVVHSLALNSAHLVVGSFNNSIYGIDQLT